VSKASFIQQCQSNINRYSAKVAALQDKITEAEKNLDKYNQTKKEYETMMAYLEIAQTEISSINGTLGEADGIFSSAYKGFGAKVFSDNVSSATTDVSSAGSLLGSATTEANDKITEYQSKITSTENEIREYKAKKQQYKGMISGWKAAIARL